jgi:Calcineurin-like phosphoesterase
MRHRPPGASRAAQDTGDAARDASSAAQNASGPEHDVIRVLAVSDEADHALQSDLGTLRGAELILACGDLPPDYLSHLMNALDLPLVFVPGNHDADMSGYRTSRAGLTLRAGLPARPPWPEGGMNADGRVVDVAGLRVAGLGGCLRYGRGPHQYTERQQSRRCRTLRRRAAQRRLRDGRGVDVLITHAPPRGVGDSEDIAHRGFGCFHGLVDALQPAALLHGHVYPHGVPAGGAWLGRTMVRNVVGLHLIDIAAGPARAAGIRHAR